MAATGKAALGAVRQDRSLKAQVFESLRDAIVDGRLVAGSLHSVQSLATELQVSRTPVREALIDLEARSMVSFERNHGVRILQTTLGDLKDVLTLRLLLEVPAAYRATEQMTDGGLSKLRSQVEEMERLKTAGEDQQVLERDREFHREIMLVAGNERLVAYVEHLRDLMVLRGVYSSDAQRDLHRHLEQHREIYEAIESRAPDAAAQAMRRHLVDTGHDLLVREGDPDGRIDWIAVGDFSPPAQR